MAFEHLAEVGRKREGFSTAGIPKNPTVFQHLLTPEEGVALTPEYPVEYQPAPITSPFSRPGITAGLTPGREDINVLDRIMKGIVSIPGAGIEFAKTVGKAAIMPPKEGFFSFKPQRLLDVARGTVGGATGGVVETKEPESEEEASRQVLGSLLGMVLPFKYIIKAGKLIGVPTKISAVAAGGALGAAHPLSKGEFGEAIERGVEGAGLVAALELGGKAIGMAFERVKGRPPKSEAEIVEAAKEPAFVEE